MDYEELILIRQDLAEIYDDDPEWYTYQDDQEYRDRWQPDEEV